MKEATDSPGGRAPVPPGRVLVVEDDEILRASLRELLEEEGFLVDTAGDGSQALAAVGRREPDVVLMDLRMPGSDGAEAMLEVKTHAPSAEIIVFSTYNDPATKKLLEDQGAFRYLVKGVSSKTIIEAVGEALDHRRARSEK